MKQQIQLLIMIVTLAAGPLVFTAGCAGGPKVSQTSVYAGDSFLFQVEKLSVQAHELFLEFYRWEQQYRSVLPVEVSRAADFCRLNEKKWGDSVDALHDAYVETPTPQNKDKLQLALNVLKAGLSQAAFYMADQSARAPNTGLDKQNGESLKALGIVPTPPGA